MSINTKQPTIATKIGATMLLFAGSVLAYVFVIKIFARIWDSQAYLLHESVAMIAVLLLWSGIQIASWLQLLRPVRRIAEFGKFDKMRLVVDTSALRSASMLNYMSASRRNEIILPQTVLTECLKGNSTKNARESLSGLAQLSNQVCVLKAGSVILGMRPRSTGLQAAARLDDMLVGFSGGADHLRSTGAEGLGW